MRIVLCAVLILCFGLAGCGFKPVYSNHAGLAGVSVRTALSEIRITPMPDRVGNHLTNALMDKIYLGGEPANPAYRLSGKVTEKRIIKTGIARDAATTREQLRLTVNMQLADTATNAVVFDRDFTSYTNYNILSSEYATLVAQDDAEARAVSQIAEDILTHLALHFSSAGE